MHAVVIICGGWLNVLWVCCRLADVLVYIVRSLEDQLTSFASQLVGAFFKAVRDEKAAVQHFVWPLRLCSLRAVCGVES